MESQQQQPQQQQPQQQQQQQQQQQILLQRVILDQNPEFPISKHTDNSKRNHRKTGMAKLSPFSTNVTFVLMQNILVFK
jgi:hypothetical protein